MRSRTNLLRAALLAATMGAATDAAAQLPNSSAAAMGMGENFTALARGFNAASWNPAGLGVPGASRSSFAFLTPRAVAGLDPVTLADLKEFDGVLVPSEVRQQWLADITTEGSQQGAAGVDLTYMAAHAGRVAVQLATTSRAVSNLSPGAAELLLFGNAGRTGQPQTIALSGSSFDLVSASTAAISYAQPLMRGATSLALGATVKYTLGHVMYTGMDVGSQATADPLQVRVAFPVITSDTLVQLGNVINNGGGWGLDLGLAWQQGGLSAGLAVKNVFNNFEWKQEKLFYRPGTATVDANTTQTEFDPLPLSAAPAALQARAEDLVYSPEVNAGVAMQVSRKLLVSADVHRRLESSRLGEPDTHVGAGVEVRPFFWLPIRAGGAVINGGHLVSGGVGLRIGIVNLNAALAQRRGELGTDRMGMFTFSAGGF